MKRKSIQTRVSRIVAHWKDCEEDFGFCALISDDEASKPCCMVCGVEPSRISAMLLGEAARTWENSGLERAHLHSVEFGGNDDPANLLMACRHCNGMMPQFDSRESALLHLSNARWVERARLGELRSRFALDNNEIMRTELRTILQARKEDYAEVAAVRQHA